VSVLNHSQVEVRTLRIVVSSEQLDLLIARCIVALLALLLLHWRRRLVGGFWWLMRTVRNVELYGHSLLPCSSLRTLCLMLNCYREMRHSRWKFYSYAVSVTTPAKLMLGAARCPFLEALNACPCQRRWRVVLDYCPEIQSSLVAALASYEPVRWCSASWLAVLPVSLFRHQCASCKTVSRTIQSVGRKMTDEWGDMWIGRLTTLQRRWWRQMQPAPWRWLRWRHCLAQCSSTWLPYLAYSWLQTGSFESELSTGCQLWRSRTLPCCGECVILDWLSAGVPRWPTVEKDIWHMHKKTINQYY